MAKFRKDTDSMGAVQVPADAYYGAQTQRSLQNFAIGRDLMPPELMDKYLLAILTVIVLLSLLPGLYHYLKKRL